MKIRISLDGALTVGEFSNDKTFTTQFVFRTNAEGAFSDTFFFCEYPRRFISDIKTFRRMPDWRASRIQTNCPGGGIRTKESESQDLLRQAREILPKLRARLADK